MSCRYFVDARDKLEHGALGQHPHCLLDRLLCLVGGVDVNHAVGKKAENTGAYFRTNDLLLYARHTDDLQGTCVDQAQVDGDVEYSIPATGTDARDRRLQAAAADVVVDFGDATDDMVIGADHCARNRAAKRIFRG